MEIAIILLGIFQDRKTIRSQLPKWQIAELIASDDFDIHCL
jgi:hypothetical protein